LLSDPAPYVVAKRVDDCRSSQALVSDALPQFKVVIISASWLSYRDNSADFLDRVADLVRELTSRGQHVIVLGRAPQFPGFDRRCAEKALRFPHMSCADHVVPLQSEVVDINQRLLGIAAAVPNAAYFDANGLLCPQSNCRLNGSDGWPQYFDSSHLSVSGSTELGRKILASGGLPTVFRVLSR